MPVARDSAQHRWIRKLIFASLPGTAGLAFRLAYEQTVMTWREGEQMVGFTLMHAYTILYIAMLLSFFLGHVAIASAVVVNVARRIRRIRPRRQWNNWALVALCICTMAVYVPYGAWMALTVRVAGPGRHGSRFLMIAAADGKVSLANALLSNGVSPNTEGGGQTALDVACSTGHIDVAKLLVVRGADRARAPGCANKGL